MHACRHVLLALPLQNDTEESSLGLDMEKGPGEMMKQASDSFNRPLSNLEFRSDLVFQKVQQPFVLLFNPAAVAC